MTASFEREEKFFKYKKPRETKCGIKSRTARGHAYGSNWWSRRWVEIMEQCIDSGRLARGKSYARKGQVKSIPVRQVHIKKRQRKLFMFQQISRLGAVICGYGQISCIVQFKTKTCAQGQVVLYH